MYFVNYLKSICDPKMIKNYYDKSYVVNDLEPLILNSNPEFLRMLTYFKDCKKTNKKTGNQDQKYVSW